MTNCLFFALKLYMRRWRKARAKGRQFDDYLVVRRSRVTWGFIHVLYGRYSKLTGQVRLLSYKPFTPQKRGVEIVFNGYVARGD